LFPRFDVDADEFDTQSRNSILNSARARRVPSKWGNEILLLTGHMDGPTFFEIDVRGFCAIDSDSSEMSDTA